MANVQIFSNEQFGNVRIVLNNAGEPLFCLPDICNVLGLTNPSSVAKRLDSSDKTKINSGGENQHSGNTKVTYITESGFYDVILFSNSPKVKPFRRWVTSEVLPSIHKTGVYKIDNNISKKHLAKLLLESEEEKERLEIENKQITLELEAAKPKIQFAESFRSSNYLILIRDLAKYINQNICPMGEHKLFDWLVQNKYLIKRPRWSQTKGKYVYDYMPTQKAADLKIFHVNPTVIHPGRGDYPFTKHTVKVNAKGQAYFINKFLNQSIKAISKD